MSTICIVAAGILASAAPNLSIDPNVAVYPWNAPQGTIFVVPIGTTIVIPSSYEPCNLVYSFRDGSPDENYQASCPSDVNMDGDCGTDADIEFFFAQFEIGGGSADFDGDGDVGTDADIEAFFRVLGGG